MFVVFLENVCDQPVHGHGVDPGDRGRAAGGDGGRRPHLGGGPRAGRGLHHLHRHRHPPLQEVSDANARAAILHVFTCGTLRHVFYSVK